VAARRAFAARHEKWVQEQKKLAAAKRRQMTQRRELDRLRERKLPMHLRPCWIADVKRDEERKRREQWLERDRERRPPITSKTFKQRLADGGIEECHQ
jgi:hypothetical protein